ncbi:MAG TPA: sodium:solute symporter family protein [Granulicella sp.]|jgi:SSS family solute:Na+ symporter|nr:sodium:solute symporter family protein [Granulicella sp.]
MNPFAAARAVATNPYSAVLAVITLTLLAVSLGRLNKTKTKADYLVAGRSLPAFVLIFTLLSSWIGSGSLLGGAENAYRHGFAALWQSAGGWAGLLLIYFIAPRARKFAQFTIPDLLEARYNQTARVLGVIAILFTYTAITSYQFIGGGDILHLIFPNAISPTLGKYLIAAFVIVFTAIAGMSSVVYMDVVIGLLATVSMLVSLPVMIHLAGGWSAVQAALPATHFQVLGDLTLTQGLELFLPTCLLMLGNQSMYQKFFSAKSEKDASRAVVGWFIGATILETVIVALAVTGSALFPAGEVHQHPREILAYSGMHGLPLGLGVLLVGAIFAKIISTANNYLFSPATNLVNDVFVRYIAPEAANKRILIVSRLMVVLLGLWALYQSTHTESVLKKALYAYTIYSAALTPVILAAFFWKRATASAAVASIAAGTFVTVFWDSAFIHHHLPRALADRDAIFPALLTSLGCLFLVSLLTPRPSAAQLDPFAAEAATPSAIAQ